jgi:uncharacterized protein
MKQMQCPLDSTNLVMAERQGIEIDYCPQCRGVWLDRGELDKIIERSDGTANTPVASHAAADRSADRQSRPSNDDYRQGGHYDERNYHQKKHKKENFLGDLFDF